MAGDTKRIVTDANTTIYLTRLDMNDFWVAIVDDDSAHAIEFRLTGRDVESLSHAIHHNWDDTGR